jgi:hypothetical protein
MATIEGRPVDRPAVSFYEITGYRGDQDPSNADRFNIYSHPSWNPALRMAWEESDVIVRRPVRLTCRHPDPLEELTTTETWTDSQGSMFVRKSIRAARGTLTETTRRDPDVNTVWKVEHLLKDEEDLLAWLDLPMGAQPGEPDGEALLTAEREVGDRGIVMVDTSDALCLVAECFDMATFTVVAFTRPDLMHRALEKVNQAIVLGKEAFAAAFPGRLWRIYGPEFASPPYLAPRLFREYVTRYDRPLVEAIQKHGGHARIHSHGRLKDILDHIVETGCMGLDPIEPPGQGDVSLAYVRERYGRQLVLFGNIEATDIENLPTRLFREKVAAALREGTGGKGRGFVLMPSACPYGRLLGKLAVANYRVMLDMAFEFGPR